MINLSAGLAYLHQALRRQADNRQYLIAQSFSFLHKYHSIRLRSANVMERQEAHFNLGRSYHIVNLHHLAIPYYLAVFQEKDREGQRPEKAVSTEETGIVRECQYNLRLCYLAKTNSAVAKRLLYKMVL